MKPGAQEALAKVVSRAAITPSRGLEFSLTLYPPRAAEAFSSWMILLWGISVARVGDMMTGPQYSRLLQMMSEERWGYSAIIVAGLSLAALIWNGHGRPTPALRFVFALFRCSFWIGLAVGYYTAVAHGAADFPMRGSLLVPIAFEIYASIWIGRDIVIHATKMPRVPARLAVRDGNG